MIVHEAAWSRVLFRENYLFFIRIKQHFESFDHSIALSLCNWSPSKNRSFLTQRIVNVHDLLMCYWNGVIWTWLQKDQRHNGSPPLMKAHLIIRSICQNLTITKNRIRSGTSLCTLQRYVPRWSCDDNNSSESKGEDLPHSNMLQSYKGRITWPDSII